MLINFCNSDFITNITCSVCESDGHSVKNLISKLELERRRGFLADYFIKPPITIDVQFVCEIQLSHVILWTRVGGQKTIGVDLLASNHECTPQSIGFAFMKNCKEDGFIFFKRGGNSIKGIDTSNFCVQTFKSINIGGVKSVHIKILKTFGSSVPALQKVEIWGEIYKSCPKKTVDFVINAWADMKNINANQYDNTIKTVSSNKYADVSDDLVSNSSQFQIPDEFLDTITCDFMTIPMILPSGKIIDISTLERYNKEEEKWGRLPSDPFTGKLFSELSRPKMSTALKLRIDKFLLDHSDKEFCKNLPRSVGNSQPFCKGAKESSIISNMRCEVSSSEVLSSTNSNHNLNVESSISMKTDRHNKRKFSFSENVAQLNQSTKLPVPSDCELHPRKLQIGSLKQYDFNSLDKIKEQSLNSSLKTILSNLPSFTKNSRPDYSVVCFKCKSNNILYELPCKHHVCRNCLTSIIETDSCTCMICLVGFNSGDPKRVHLTNY